MEEDKKKAIQEARARLAEKCKDVRTGGPGTQRRKFKAVHKGGASDTKLEAVMKKFNTQPIPDITEVNFFTKDHKVISFQKPQVHASFQTQTMILSGTPVTRELKSCFSEMMNQLGPKQLADLKKLGLAQLPSEPTSEPKVNFQKVADEN